MNKVDSNYFFLIGVNNIYFLEFMIFNRMRYSLFFLIYLVNKFILYLNFLIFDYIGKLD